MIFLKWAISQGGDVVTGSMGTNKLTRASSETGRYPPPEVILVNVRDNDGGHGGDVFTNLDSGIFKSSAS